MRQRHVITPASGDAGGPPEPVSAPGWSASVVDGGTSPAAVRSEQSSEPTAGRMLSMDRSPVDADEK